MKYTINFDKLIDQWLRPLYIGKPKVRALIAALVYPARAQHAAFLAFKAKTDQEITITIQVNRMRQALRDKFGDSTIDIVHPGDYLAEAYIYLLSEPHPDEWDYQLSEDHQPIEYDYLAGEYSSQLDYIVTIPASLAAQALQIYAFVNTYNFSSRRFAVQTV